MKEKVTSWYIFVFIGYLQMTQCGLLQIFSPLTLAPVKILADRKTSSGSLFGNVAWKISPVLTSAAGKQNARCLTKYLMIKGPYSKTIRTLHDQSPPLPVSHNSSLYNKTQISGYFFPTLTWYSPFPLDVALMYLLFLIFSFECKLVVWIQ